jgi:hypothetical protein
MTAIAQVRRAALGLLVSLFACTSEVKIVDAPTQVTLSIDTRSELLRERLDNIRITVSRPRSTGADAVAQGDWGASVSTTVARPSIVRWPLEIPLIPTVKEDAASYFEVVVDARRGEVVLAQMRGISRFVPRQRLRFPLLVEPCADRELGMLCTADADCHGTECAVCAAGGGCSPVAITDPSTLEDLAEPFEVDAGLEPSRDAGADARRRDAQPGDASSACSSEGTLRCAAGSARERCESGAWVQAEPCPDQTMCSTGSDGAASCSNACDALTCDVNAKCAVIDGMARCQCTPPYVGDGATCRFDDACAALACDANGECAMVGAERECRCRPGYTGNGKSCTNIDECKATPTPCDVNATCTDTPGAFSCACKAGYTGTGMQCSSSADCATNPCQHGGRCMGGVGAVVCDCSSTGYTGDRCQTAIDECMPNPCMNGGSCSDQVNGYLCDCAGTGYTGARCQSNVDDCASNPCMHGGSCTDGVGATSCSCAGTGYSGPRCETNVNDCSPNPCLNGGSCSDGVSTYTCSCRAGYSGARCETDVDNCSPNPCRNGGTCTDRVNGYQCSCPVGWGGTRCETKACGDGDVDVGEECDYNSSPSAKWTCDSSCRRATLYTGCVNAACMGAGIACTVTQYCALAPCTTTSDCPAPAGANVACEFRQCFVRCTALSDCAPGTFCDRVTGNCAGVQHGICADDPFSCPPGSICSESSCYAR